MTNRLEHTDIDRADDRRIAAECARGEISVFEMLYRDHGSRMKAVAFRYLGSRSEAEDAVQEAFLKIHRSASSYNGEAPFRTWVYRVLVNTCADMLRKRVRRPAETEMEKLAGRHEEKAATADAATRLTLQKLIAELEPQRRTVLILFEIEGFSHAEIGRILGISEASSKWILFETKKQIRNQWRSS